jgi:hypothetical protein
MPGVEFFSSHAPRANRIPFSTLPAKIPFPFAGIANAHCIDVRIVNNNFFAVPDPAYGVAHLVEARLVKTELAHLGLDTFPDIFQLSIHAGNGANIAHELDNVALRGLHTCLNFYDFIFHGSFGYHHSPNIFYIPPTLRTTWKRK